jgi:peptidoglycan/LPS O-acetylase OafA/YrhL
VDIFFGISGFLICSRLIEELRGRGEIDLKKFYVRRAFRILPPAVVYLLAVAVLSLTGVTHTPLRQWVGALLFYGNYVKNPVWQVGHFWSLAIEEHFYLFWPVLLAWIGVRRSGFAAVLMIAGIFLLRCYGAERHYIIFPNYGSRTDLRMDGLLWGCIVAVMASVPGWRKRMGRMLTPGVFLGLLAMYVVSVVYPTDSAVYLFVIPPMQAALIPFLLVATVLHPGSWAGRFLEWVPCRKLGRISYSLYLWQQLFLTWVPFFPGKLVWLQWFPVNMAGALMCAVGSYYVIERPMIRLGHRLAPPVTEGRVDLAGAG